MLPRPMCTIFWRCRPAPIRTLAHWSSEILRCPLSSVCAIRRYAARCNAQPSDTGWLVVGCRSVSWCRRQSYFCWNSTRTLRLCSIGSLTAATRHLETSPTVASWLSPLSSTTGQCGYAPPAYRRRNCSRLCPPQNNCCAVNTTQ